MIGRTLSGYRIIEQIGMGGMATVYKAFDPGTDRYVAIKILPEHYSQDSTFIERFQREAKALARLEHIHILPIFGYGQEEGVTYLVMRYMQAGTLAGRIKERGPFALHEAGRLLSQVASALDYAHIHKVLHRDVKPSNVLLDSAENAYLTDFGIAKMVEATLDLTGTNILGTPAYMSPEQCLGGTTLTPASDQYSLGIVLYEMVAGRTPFQAETPLALIHMHLNAPLPLPRSFRPDLPEDVERILLKTLAREPQLRFDTCGAMADAFARAIAGLPVEITSIPMAGADDRTMDVAAETVKVMSAASPVTRPVAAGAPLPSSATVPAAAQQRAPTWLWPVIALAGVIVLGGLAFALGLLKAPGSSPSGPVTRPRTAAPVSTIEPGLLEQGALLVGCGSDLCLVDTQHRSKGRITLDADYINMEGVTWSPDGKSVAFGACRADEQVPSGNCQSVKVINRDTGRVQNLFLAYGENAKLPAWSPDGQWIAFHKSCSLMVIRPDGTDLTELTQGSGSGWCAEFIAWSPDSRQIAWIGGNGDVDTPFQSDRIWVINQDGTGLRNVMFLDGDQFAGNTDGSLAWAPDGTAVVAATRTGKIYRIPIECDVESSPCAPESLEQLRTFPIHWLHYFYPQWLGEEISD